MLLAFGVLTSLAAVSGFPEFVDYIPNGVEFGGGLGHTHGSGGGRLNSFGEDFQLFYRWTPELCELDSDGDGRSNGVELGDPHCTWERWGEPPLRGVSGHPGQAEEESEL